MQLSNEKKVYLACIEALVLRGAGKLESEELEQVKGLCDLDEFYERQPEEVRHAIDSCIGVHGHGLEQLLDEFSKIELE